MLKLNLGCGPRVVDGWVNVDYALGARLATVRVLRPALRRLQVFGVDWDPRIRIHDLTTPLPWGNATVDVCYTSHTVEHLSRDEGRFLASEAFRVLKPGGILRVIVPDIAPILERYRRGETAADHLVEELGVLYGSGKQGARRVLAPLVEFPHKCMYDTPAMQRLLQSIGFDARPRMPFDSAIDDVRSIELEDRTIEAVIVEGRKPAGAAMA